MLRIKMHLSPALTPLPCRDYKVAGPGSGPVCAHPTQYVVSVQEASCETWMGGVDDDDPASL